MPAHQSGMFNQSMSNNYLKDKLSDGIARKSTEHFCSGMSAIVTVVESSLRALCKKERKQLRELF